MNRFRTSVALAVLAASLGVPSAAEAETTTGYSDTVIGLILGLARNLCCAHDRVVGGSCVYRVDTTTGNDVLMTVRGTGSAGGRPRVTATEIQCVVINSLGATVFDLTRSESGPVAPLAGAVIIRNNAPYTVCARADAKYDDGEDVYWPSSNTLTCIEP